MPNLIDNIAAINYKVVGNVATLTFGPSPGIGYNVVMDFAKNGFDSPGFDHLYPDRFLVST